MKKVKEYLDKYFFPCEDRYPNTITLRKNGHYGVSGGWRYPKEKLNFPDMYDIDYNKKLPNWINIVINNETIIVGNMHVRGKKNLYHYLQTYEHIPRGEPDENGYYKRSTEEEIIKYIDSYYRIIAVDILRNEKIESIL